MVPRDLTGCQELKLDQPHARLAYYQLYYHFPPLHSNPTNFKIKSYSASEFCLSKKFPQGKWAILGTESLDCLLSQTTLTGECSNSNSYFEEKRLTSLLLGHVLGLQGKTGNTLAPRVLPGCPSERGRSWVGTTQPGPSRQSCTQGHREKVADL